MQKLKKSWKNYLSRSLTAVQCLEIPEVSRRVSGVRDACEGSAVLGSDAAAVLVTKGWIMGGGAMQV